MAIDLSFLKPLLTRRVLLLTLAVGGTLGLLGAGYSQYRLMAGTSAAGVFEVPHGEAESITARRLAAEGRVPVAPILLRIGLRLTAYAGDIKVGEYQIGANQSAYQLLFLLRSGKVKQYSITFPEGWTVAEWRTALAAQPALRQLTTGLSEAALATRLGAEGPLEGWLFPDTYAFVKGDSDLALLRRAHRKMAAEMARLWEPLREHPTLDSPQKLLTLASIIEKETGRAADRGLIASVFHNRLKLGMRLESDPTVIYALGDAFDGDLKRPHLKLDHPFNTYVRWGLPPTPICNPGLDALQAAVSPAVTDFLYFVGKGNGESHFSVSLAEHNSAVDRYQRNRGPSQDGPLQGAQAQGGGLQGGRAQGNQLQGGQAQGGHLQDAQAQGSQLQGGQSKGGQ